MAKSQTSYGTNAANNLNNQAQGFAGPGSPLYQGFQSSLSGGQSRQSELYDNALAGYKQQQTTGGYDPTQLANLRSNVSSNMQTGGYDPAVASDIMSGYGNFATTGGFTPTQEQAFIRQATQGVTGTYNTLQQQAMQDKARTGGLGTGGDISQMARQLTQAQAGATLNAETALQQIESQNKLAGLGGEAGFAGQQAQGRLAATGQGIGLESGVASGVQGANAGLSNLFNTQTGQVTALGNQLLQTLGLDFSTQAEAASILSNLSKNPGLFQTGIADVVALAGAAAPFAKPGGCWIAEAIYGIDDPRTHLVRAFLNGPFRETLLGRFVMSFYLTFGQFIASQVRRYDFLKRALKPLFDRALREALCL